MVPFLTWRGRCHSLKLWDPTPDQTIFDAHSCFVWKVSIEFSFETRGSITVTSWMEELRICSGVPGPPAPTGLLYVQRTTWSVLVGQLIHLCVCRF